MSDTAKIAALILWIAVCTLLSLWAWVQLIQWVAEDVKCP